MWDRAAGASLRLCSLAKRLQKILVVFRRVDVGGSREVDRDEGEGAGLLMGADDCPGADVAFQVQELREDGAVEKDGIAEAVAIARGDDGRGGLAPSVDQGIDDGRFDAGLIAKEDDRRLDPR